MMLLKSTKELPINQRSLTYDFDRFFYQDPLLKSSSSLLQALHLEESRRSAFLRTVRQVYQKN